MTIASISDYYLPDLAHIHDVGFSGFGTKAAGWIIRLLKKRGITSGRIVELGCGSGVVTHSLVQHGYRVSAVDGSSAMIRLARTACPQAHFSVGSLWTYNIEPCKAVIAVGECLNYEFDGTNTLGHMRQLFSRVHDALRPGGVFVFDLLLLSQGNTKAKSQKFTQGKDWFVAVNRAETRTHIVREIVHFRKHGSSYQKGVEIHHQRKYALAGVRAALVRTGFAVQTYRGYGKSALGKGHMVLVAEKRAAPGSTKR